MQAIAHGIDLVDNRRIAEVWKRHGDHFLTRVFTARERDYCTATRRAVERLSGRFAAKEAVLKMLGTGWRGGILWTDIETLPDAFGKPIVTLTGETAQCARAAGIRRVLLSISHAGDYAMASAIGLGEAPASGR